MAVPCRRGVGGGQPWAGSARQTAGPAASAGIEGHSETRGADPAERRTRGESCLGPGQTRLQGRLAGLRAGPGLLELGRGELNVGRKAAVSWPRELAGGPGARPRPEASEGGGDAAEGHGGGGVPLDSQLFVELVLQTDRLSEGYVGVQDGAISQAGISCGDVDAEVLEG